MAHEVESMFYVKVTDRDIPWHRLGVPVAGLLTAAEAIEVAGLDWQVRMEPMHVSVPVLTPDGVGSREDTVPGVRAVLRDSDDAILGVVGSRYHPIQNGEMFSLLDTLVDSGDAKYETAGSLAGGRVVWMLARMDRVLSVDGDDVTPYLVATTSHDGRSALTIATTPVRVVCMNTLRWGLQQAKSKWTTRHTASATRRVQEAREALGIVHTAYDAFEVEAQALIAQEVTNLDFRRIVNALVPVDTTSMSDRQVEFRIDRQSQLRDLYSPDRPTIGPYYGTGWGVLNAVNEWDLWSRPVRGDRMERHAAETIGSGFGMTDHAAKVLAAFRTE